MRVPHKKCGEMLDVYGEGSPTNAFAKPKRKRKGANGSSSSNSGVGDGDKAKINISTDMTAIR